MLPFAEYLLDTLMQLSETQGGGPVRTVVLADVLRASPRTVRWYASRLEAAGLVTRRSPRSGWLPALA